MWQRTTDATKLTQDAVARTDELRDVPVLCIDMSLSKYTPRSRTDSCEATEVDWMVSWSSWQLMTTAWWYTHHMNSVFLAFSWSRFEHIHRATSSTQMPKSPRSDTVMQSCLDDSSRKSACHQRTDAHWDHIFYGNRRICFGKVLAFMCCMCDFIFNCIY